MRVAHICLSCFYIDGFGYQENELVRQHVADGHDVLVIASTETYGLDKRLSYVLPGSYMGSDGAMVVRLAYKGWLPHSVMTKLRMHPGVYSQLDLFKPDVVMFHGLCGWELLSVARYKKNNPGVRFFADSHEDFNNSARGWISRELLHKIYYAKIIQRCLPCIDQILCLSLDCINFVESVYRVPRERLEFYPLGGNVYPDDEYQLRRRRGRDSCGVDEEDVMLLQTGKMGARKKVLESIRSFKATKGESLRFILAGSFDPQIESQALELISTDPRIKFLGWKNVDELKDLLCAADVYIQPGTQSATMQMSLCARCPVVLDDVLSHRIFVDGNGWLIKDVAELSSVFEEIRDGKTRLDVMAEKSLAVARRWLDYRTLAARVLQ